MAHWGSFGIGTSWQVPAVGLPRWTSMVAPSPAAPAGSNPDDPPVVSATGGLRAASVAFQSALSGLSARTTYAYTTLMLRAPGGGLPAPPSTRGLTVASPGLDLAPTIESTSAGLESSGALDLRPVDEGAASSLVSYGAVSYGFAAPGRRSTLTSNPLALDTTSEETASRLDSVALTSWGSDSPADLYRTAFADASAFGPFAAVSDGSFVVDGRTIAVSTDDSLQAIARRINESGARVTAGYDAAAETFVIRSAGASGDEVPIGDDTSGLLAVLGLDAGATVRGYVRDDREALSRTWFGWGMSAGSFSVNGVDVAFNPEEDSLASVLDRITRSAAGVTAGYDAETGTVTFTSKADSEAEIAVADNGTGFFDNTGLSWALTDIGHVAEDRKALSALAGYESVTAGTFEVDGHAIAVDPAADTFRTIVDRINRSGARVVAQYDAADDTITIRNTYNSDEQVAIGNDTSGFLQAAFLDAANSVTGRAAASDPLLVDTRQFAGVTSGTFEINGRTFDVDTQWDTLGSVIDRFNYLASDLGLSASYDAATGRVRIEGGGDPIVVGSDSTGFLAAARLRRSAPVPREPAWPSGDELEETNPDGALDPAPSGEDRFAADADPNAFDVAAVPAPDVWSVGAFNPGTGTQIAALTALAVDQFNAALAQYVAGLPEGSTARDELDAALGGALGALEDAGLDGFSAGDDGASLAVDADRLARSLDALGPGVDVGALMSAQFDAFARTAASLDERAG